MSNRVRKIRENMTLRFPEEMYNNTLGSLFICKYIFTEGKKSVRTTKKLYREAQKKSIDITKDSWIKDLLGEIPAIFPVVLVKSDWNSLFAPYIDGEVLPIREDGKLSSTLRKGKIVEVNFDA